MEFPPCSCPFSTAAAPIGWMLKARVIDVEVAISVSFLCNST
jgi:hypothetical protein